MSGRAVLLLLIGAALLAAVAALSLPSGSDDPAGVGTALLPDVNIGDVKTLTIKDMENSLAFSRSDMGWKLDTFPALPLDQGKVRAFLLSVPKLIIEDVKTADPALHSAVGLAQSAVTIQLGDEGFLLGKDAVGGGRFARRLGKDQSYVVTNISPPQTTFKTWLDLDLPTLAADSVTKVEITRGGARYSIAKDADKKPVLEGLKEGESLAYDTVLETVIGGAVFIDYEDIRSASDVDWAQADESIFYGAQDGDQIRYSVAEQDGDVWLKIEPQGSLAPEGDLDWPAYAFAISDYRRSALVKPRSELIASEDEG